MKKMRIFWKRFFISLTALLILYALSATKSAPEEREPPGAEQEIESKIEKRKDMPTPRGNLGAASDNSRVYAAGGWGSHGLLRSRTVMKINPLLPHLLAEMRLPSPGASSMLKA